METRLSWWEKMPGIQLSEERRLALTGWLFN